MPIDTYAGLKSAIADFLNREDLTAVIPSFISLAEADISRVLRDWRMETRTTLTVAAQYEPLPIDWLETVRINLSNGTHRLDLASDGALAEMRAARGDLSGRPTHYAHTSGGLELFPTPSAPFDAELVYFAKVPTLSDTATSNWLLATAPDVYLYGALTQSAPYLKDDQRAVIWSGLYQNAVNGLNTASERARHSGAGLRLRLRGM